MTLAKALSAALRGTGIPKKFANPGVIRTRLTEKTPAPRLMDPDQTACTTAQHMTTDTFKIRFPMVLRLLSRQPHSLPGWAYHPIFAPTKRPSGFLFAQILIFPTLPTARFFAEKSLSLSELLP